MILQIINKLHHDGLTTKAILKQAMFRLLGFELGPDMTYMDPKEHLWPFLEARRLLVLGVAHFWQLWPKLAS